VLFSIFNLALMNIDLQSFTMAQKRLAGSHGRDEPKKVRKHNTKSPPPSTVMNVIEGSSCATPSLLGLPYELREQVSPATAALPNTIF